MAELNLIKDEILVHGTSIESKMQAVSANTNVQVVSIGETHHVRSSFRALYAPIVKALSEGGFSYLLLECTENLRPYFEDFSCERLSLDELQKTLHQKGYGLFFDFDQEQDGLEVPDEFFFGMLETAKENRLVILPIDGEPGTSRDSIMARHLIEHSQSGRVILWGGYKHHYTRTQERGKFLTTIELARELIGKDRIFSIVGHTAEDIPISDLGMIALELERPLIVDISDCENLSQKVSCIEARCHFGTCERKDLHSGGIIRCFTGSKDPLLCPKDGLFEIHYGNWDGLVLAPPLD